MPDQSPTSDETGDRDGPAEGPEADSTADQAGGDADRASSPEVGRDGGVDGGGEQAPAVDSDALLDERVVPATSVRPPRPWAVRLRRAGAWAGVVALWSGAAAGGGYWLGHRDATASVVVPAPVVDVEVVAPDGVATDGPAPAPTAPDVVGLSLDRAREALVDAQIDLDGLRVDEAEQVGQEGLVVAQEPLGGLQVDGPVSLTLSVPAAVPDVIGGTEQDARDQLAGLGARVRRVPVYRQGAEVGTVLDVTPAPGATLVEEATLQVAVAPDGVLLTDVEAFERDCRVVDDIVVSRTTYGSALACTVRQGRDYQRAWLLTDGIDGVTATVGLADTSDAAGRVRFELRSEDGVLAEAELGLGEDATLSASLDGAVRVELWTVSLEPDDADWDDVVGVWGEPTLTGSPSAVDELVGRG